MQSNWPLSLVETTICAGMPWEPFLVFLCSLFKASLGVLFLYYSRCAYSHAGLQRLPPSALAGRHGTCQEKGQDSVERFGFGTLRRVFE